MHMECCWSSFDFVIDAFSIVHDEVCKQPCVHEIFGCSNVWSMCGMFCLLFIGHSKAQQARIYVVRTSKLYESQQKARLLALLTQLHLVAGKTLIARQIGKMLNGKEPKVVNGPEILNKYVGASEENVRKLFEEAEADQAAHGEASELHVIIFDEIDAICKSRGSVNSGAGVHDTVVNQLLTKIDGVDSLNNILLIGMTNRKDMLDEALLRPGRLEVQVEIGLPDDKGRLQILQVPFLRMQ